MGSFSDSEILRSWHLNADPWTKAVQNDEIESRRLVTNQAIIGAVSGFSPARVLDVGCGEGWLARALADKGMHVTGIDAVPRLIEKAQQLGKAQFSVCTYENLPAHAFDAPFDCILCNFSLIGEASTEIVIRASASLLAKGGRLLIQTLHPVAACGDFAYKDGWRPGSWAGFSAEFKEPAPWYFRTIESWCRLLAGSGFQLPNIHEPLHPKTQKPASVIFECSAAPA